VGDGTWVSTSVHTKDEAGAQSRTRRSKTVRRLEVKRVYEPVGRTEERKGETYLCILKMREEARGGGTEGKPKMV